eukprot:IDg2426t1
MVGNKKKTQRLPSSERTLVGSKIIHSERTSSASSSVSDVPTTLRLDKVRSPTQAAPQPRSLTTRPSSRLWTEIHDDTLRKVLRYSGPLAILAASRVCRHWRRVALVELYETTSFNYRVLYAAT